MIVTGLLQFYFTFFVIKQINLNIFTKEFIKNINNSEKLLTILQSCGNIQDITTMDNLRYRRQKMKNLKRKEGNVLFSFIGTVNVTDRMISIDILLKGGNNTHE